MKTKLLVSTIVCCAPYFNAFAVGIIPGVLVSAYERLADSTVDRCEYDECEKKYIDDNIRSNIFSFYFTHIEDDPSRSYFLMLGSLSGLTSVQKIYLTGGKDENGESCGITVGHGTSRKSNKFGVVKYLELRKKVDEKVEKYSLSYNTNDSFFTVGNASESRYRIKISEPHHAFAGRKSKDEMTLVSDRTSLTLTAHLSYNDCKEVRYETDLLGMDRPVCVKPEYKMMKSICRFEY